VIASLLTLAACEKHPSAPVAQRPIRVALYASPQSLDPHRYSEFLTSAVLSNAYESLVSLDRELKITPALAERWENPDERTWRFRLRPGVRFHDGTTLDADDVVYSLERARRLAGSTFTSYLASVQTIRALDGSTVELTTDGAVTVLLGKLAMIHVVPAGYAASDGPSRGTGPYRLSVAREGNGILLRAFEGYWGGQAATAELLFVPVLDAEERRRRLLAGELDLLWEVHPDAAKQIEGAACCRIVRQASLVVEVLRVNLAEPPFSDRRVRRAVSLALDRSALAEAIWRGYATPANQLVGRQVLGFEPGREELARDLLRARRLLEEAGYVSGLDLALEYREGRRAQPIRDQLAEAGIRVSLRPRPWTQMLPRLLDGKVSLYYGALVADSGDANDVLASALATRDARGAGDSNYSGYSSRELDRLLLEADRAKGIPARTRLLQQAMKLAMDELPIIPLLIPDDIYALRRDIRWSPRADGRVLAWDLRREPDVAARAPHPQP